MRIALDATYSVDPRPSGIAVYSRELLHGLATENPDDQFLHCYRAKQLKSSTRSPECNASRRLLLPGLPTFHADLFHGLNQRVDVRPARKVVSTFHDLFVFTGQYSTPEFQARFAAQARRAAQNSDLVIAVSHFTAQQVAQLLQVDSGRIRVIPHGVHQPVAGGSAIPRENLILFVGALQLRKNVMRLVQAFEALASDHESWRLVLAGAPSGFGAQDILKRIEASKCRKRIEVTGYVAPNALEDLYRRAAIFAFPSLDEGFGMPVLEAMAHGLPVLTSNRSALPEVAGEAAILVDPENTDEIATQLRGLMRDPQLRQMFAQRGLVRAEQYPWQRAVSLTHGVYRELLR